MADNNSVLNISAGGTDARGLAAAEFPSRFHPQDVLKYALAQDDANRVRAQKASTEALKRLQELKVSGWRNHVDEIATKKQDILNKSVEYFKRYPKSMSFSDYDPYNEKQSKLARELQEMVNGYQADIEASNQFKQWAQVQESKINAKDAKNKYTEESINKVTKLAALPLSEQEKYFEEHGRELPELEPRYDYFTDGWKVAKSVGTKLNEFELGGRKITDKRAIDEYINGSVSSFFGGSPSGQQYVAKMQEENPAWSLDDIERDFRKKYVEPHLSETYKNVLSSTGSAEEKEKADVTVVPVSETMETPSYSLFTDDKGTQYNVTQKAVLTPKDPQKVRNVMSEGQWYKISPRSEGANKKLIPAAKDVEFATVPTIINTDNGDWLEATRKEPTFVRVTQPKTVKVEQLFEYYPEMVDDYEAADTQGKEAVIEQLRTRLAEDGGVTRDETVVYRKKINPELKARLEPLIKGGYPKFSKTETKATTQKQQAAKSVSSQQYSTRQQSALTAFKNQLKRDPTDTELQKLLEKYK